MRWTSLVMLAHIIRDVCITIVMDARSHPHINMYADISRRFNDCTQIGQYEYISIYSYCPIVCVISLDIV